MGNYSKKKINVNKDSILDFLFFIWSEFPGQPKFFLDRMKYLVYIFLIFSAYYDAVTLIAHL